MDIALSDRFMSFTALSKIDTFLAVSEEREDSFPVDPNREFLTLVNQNKRDHWFLVDLLEEAVSWMESGGQRECVFTSTLGCTTLSAGQEC